MAQFNYRTSLIQSNIPLLSEDLSQTIIVGQASNESNTDNTPQIAYIHNMMPTAEGMVATAFEEAIPAVGTGFRDVFIIFGNKRTRLHLAIEDNGAMYVLKPNATAWLPVPFNLIVTDILLTVGTVDGITYIYFEGIGCFQFNEDAEFLVPVNLLGLNLSNIIGITASSGYLIAFTKSSLAWSSTISPTDFVPDSTTGAGGGDVADIEGAIVFAVPNSLGFLIYSETNVVAVTFTGNRQYPFKFREVTNSKGTLNLDLIAHEANSKEHFVFSKAGLQAVDSQIAKNFLPEVTDFLAGKQVEDFDESTKTFTTTNLTATMLKKVKFIASRYLVLSYGATDFTHALIYDIVLQRLGKIKLVHVDAFEYIGLQQEIAKNTIAFLTTDGSVQLLGFSTTNSNASGVVIVGKYQYARSRTIQLEQVEVANVKTADTFTCSALVSLNGYDTDNIKEGYLVETGKKVRKYNFHFSAKNFFLAFIGKMDLNNLLLTFTIGGKR